MKQPKVLPIVYVILLSGIMIAITNLLPYFLFHLPFAWAFSAVILLIGFSIIVVSGSAFRRVNTTVNPLTTNKSTYLVTEGIYHYSRNPMYVAFTLFLVAAAIYSQNFLSFLLIPPFVVTITFKQIIPEELYLEQLFGDEFRDYKARVARWI